MDIRPTVACLRRSKNTSRRGPGCGNIRVGLMCAAICRRQQPEKSSASSCVWRMPETMKLNFFFRGRHIEGVWHGPPPDQAPTLVLLHEGLGCVTMWRDFPQVLSERTGCGVLAYSRRGYGKSGVRPLPWPVTYMQDEAFDVLPRVLDQADVRDCILVGHSDGA